MSSIPGSWSRRQAWRVLIAGIAGIIFAGMAAPSHAQETLQAIATPGRARLQMCRSWVMYDSCNEYGRVGVPQQIKVGDQLFLEFGSNPKSMTFPVVLIRFAAGVCTLYSEPPGPNTDESRINKLTVTPCRKPGT
jgi:hypothetical protein